jgi:hypothetical protein
MYGVPVFDMEEVEALTKDLRLMIGLDAKSLPGMYPPETLIQLEKQIVLHLVRLSGCCNQRRMQAGGLSALRRSICSRASRSGATRFVEAAHSARSA